MRFYEPWRIQLVRGLRRITPNDARALPITLAAYNSMMHEAAIVKNLGPQGVSGDSPRAGFATHLHLKHGTKALPTIKDVCRWQSEKMLKVYLNVVGATASAHSKEVERTSAVADEAEALFRSRLMNAGKQQ